ncbi:MAG: putative transporter protein [Eubacterium sp.]|nr:putative transporter protein [Eubacterium sp.]
MNEISEISAAKGTNKKWALLFVVVLMSFMSCLDASIVNVALPVMSKVLTAKMSSIQWVITSYILTICITILIFGKLGDIIGKMKVFKFGMVVFTISSLLCGLSTSLSMLVLLRIIQGIGAAAYMANNQGIITEAFPKNERGKALGFLATGVAVGTMLGTPLGGIIISEFKWNYIFFINVPIGVLAFIAGNKILKEKNSITSCEKFDIKRTLNIFKNAVFTISLLCAFISFICISASNILIPFFLQDTLKISSSYTGMIMMVSPLIVAVISPISGNLSDRTGSYVLSFLGLLVMSCGFYLMSMLNESSPVILLVIFLSATALGQGIFQPTNNSLIMSSVAKNQLGIAGSFNSLVRNLGQSTGVMISTCILFSFMSKKIGFRVNDYISGRDDIFVFGMKKVYIALFAICLAGALVTLYRLYRRNKEYRIEK